MSSGAPVHAMTVRAAARKAGLSRCAKAMLGALIDRADHKTWAVPSPEGRISVRTLAADAGYSQRHGSRGLRDLALRGITGVDPGAWEPNRYHVRPEALLHLAETRRGLPRLILASSVEELELTATPRSDAGIPRESRRPRLESAEESKPAPLTWWQREGARLRSPPEEVYALVAGVARLVTGQDHAETELGTLARPVLRLWRRLDRPPIASLLEQVELLTVAIHEGCTEDTFLHLRGLRRVGGHRGGRRRGAIERMRGDHSRELPPVLAVGPWVARLAAARRHAAGSCPCGRRAPSAPPRLVVVADVEALLGEGLPAATAAAADRWEGTRQALRAQLGRQDWEIWIQPLSSSGVVEGELRLVAPNAPFLAYVRDHYGQEIARLVRAPVRLQLPDTS